MTPDDAQPSPLNIDPDELAKFSAIANEWWDPHGAFKPLHDINPLRVNFIHERVELAEADVLDVGCGGGILTEAMAQRGARVTGIDMSEKPLSVAQMHQQDTPLGIHYEGITAEQLAQRQPASFDVVTCLEMLEHVPDPESVINACMTLVKPGGSVFFSTINRNPKSYAFAIIGAEYVLNLLPKGTHDYRKFIRPSELSAWSRRQGLVVKDTVGMAYNPITRRYKLSDHDVSVNYLMHTTKAE